MFFITTQPDHKYYEWQIEAQLYNLYKQLEYTIPYICLLTEESEKRIDVRRLKKKFPLFNAYYFKDERQAKHYQPSIQPFLLKKVFHHNKNYCNQTSIIIDADVVFSNKLDLEQFKDQDQAFLSNTSSYLDYKYIFSKGGDELFNKMCEICSINPSIVKEEIIGGAQYILPSNTALFWSKVESDSILLYDYLRSSIDYYREKSETPDTYHPIQIWTASMWAIYYNLIYFNFKRNIPNTLNFCWPTDDIKRWDEVSIYHNAGISEALSNEYFFKGRFINQPPVLSDIDKDFNKEKCSSNYVDILRKSLFSS